MGQRLRRDGGQQAFGLPGVATRRMMEGTSSSHVAAHTQHRRDLRFHCSWPPCGVVAMKLNGLGSVKNVSSAADEDYWRTLQKVSEKSRDQLSVQSVCFVKGEKIPNAVLWADVIDQEMSGE